MRHAFGERSAALLLFPVLQMRAFFSDHAGEILTDRVAAVREDHNDHPDRDKGAEDLHDAGGGEASLDHERVDSMTSMY